MRQRVSSKGWRWAWALGLALVAVWLYLRFQVFLTDGAEAECRQLYSSARSALDSAAADSHIPQGIRPRENAGRVTCGALRQTGQLGR
jgi:hypothetical protein